MPAPSADDLRNDRLIHAALTRVVNEGTASKIEVTSPGVSINSANVSGAITAFREGKLQTLAGKVETGVAAKFVPPQAGVPSATIVVPPENVPKLGENLMQANLFHELYHYAQYRKGQYLRRHINREINAYIASMLYYQMRFGRVVPFGGLSAKVEPVFREASILAGRAMRKEALDNDDVATLRAAVINLHTT